MSHHRPPAADAPFNLESDGRRFVFGAAGLRHPVVRTSRRSVVIAYGPKHLRLRRRHLERHGFAVAGGRVFSVSRYYVPAEQRAA